MRAVVAVCILAACDESGQAPPEVTAEVAVEVVAEVTEEVSEEIALELPGTPIAAEPQRSGDPAKGFTTLAEGAYVGCGVPAELYPIAERAGIFGDEPTLPGRDSALPYYLSQFTTVRGVEVVGPNCFTCHAGDVAGELVLGAPGIDLDFGGFAAQIAGFQSQVAAVEGILAPESFAELERFADRLATVAPWVQAAVAGTNPADNLAGILFSHRDPESLAWFDEPLMEPPEQVVLPVDVPPLWRMKKKNAMFYAAAGRGDHARIMMTAATLCVDSREEAAAIDATFGDVRAWILALQAPVWPEDKLGPIDRALAAEGEVAFLRECAQCHGTYGSTDSEDTYPNLWVAVEDVATDAAVAIGAAHAATRFVEWFNTSFYGETAYLDPKPGYVPPPLDGIWATAPYLHNASVPTLAAMLDARLRPKYWRRTAGWDAANVGLEFRVNEVGHADMTGNKRGVYDTTLLGHGNAGHFYGDALSDTERRAVLEYLKTL